MFCCILRILEIIMCIIYFWFLWRAMDEFVWLARSCSSNCSNEPHMVVLVPRTRKKMNSGAWRAGADDNKKHPTPNAPGESGWASSAAFTTPPLPQWEGLPPTPSKGAEEDFQGPGGSECRICQKFVRGGRWAMRSHQIASSRRFFYSGTLRRLRPRKTPIK